MHHEIPQSTGMLLSKLLFCTVPLLGMSIGSRAQEKEAKTDVDNVVVDRNIVYSKPEGTELLLDVYRPTKVEKRPAILVVHGGGWSSGNKGQLAAYARSLVPRGYTCFAINYRLSPKFQYPAQIDDCRAALRFIRSNADKYGVDSKRIGGIGYSAGGHLVSLLGVTSKDHPDASLQAVVAGGAPVEFREMKSLSKAVSRFLGGSEEEKKDIYRLASPLALVSDKCPPFFFYHGTGDELVGVVNVEKMVGELKSKNVPAELFLIDKAKHVPAAMDRPALQKAFEFFDQYLQVKAPAGN